MWDQQAIRDFNRSVERTTPVALVLCTVLYVNTCGHMVSTSGSSRIYYIYSHYVSSFCVDLHGNSNTLVTSIVWHYGVWVAILWCRAQLIRLM